MKTTVDIADTLFAEARRVAHEDGTTLRSLIEEGLRHVIAERGNRTRYIMPDRSVGGDGLTPEFRDAGWDRIRDAIYESHGA
ncbi:MAG: type II toxin-antitoxin system VapB family antitoxin [Chloroflexota bacterium]